MRLLIIKDALIFQASLYDKALFETVTKCEDYPDIYILKCFPVAANDYHCIICTYQGTVGCFVCIW